MVHKFSDLLCTSSLQFGFTAKRSISICTMVLKEVIAYYSKHGPLYCVMLDATKAFDRVIIASYLGNFLTGPYHLNIYDCYSTCIPIMLPVYHGMAFALQNF